MFIKLLQLILVLVAIRFIVRLVRQVFSAPSRRPEVHSRRGPRDEPVRGKRIIDVEFTEDDRDDGPGDERR